MWRSTIPDALDDPLVRRLDPDRREVVIRHHVARECLGRCRRLYAIGRFTRPVSRRTPTPSAQTLADLFVHARLDGAHCDLHRVLDGARRRVAVADDADAAHAEQRRAAVLGVIEMLRAPLRACLCRSPARRARGSTIIGIDGLVELEHDVADEAVADDDVDRAAIARAGGKIASLDVAVEVEACALKQS